MSGKRNKPKRKADSTLAQFGIFDIPDVNSLGDDDDDDDEGGNDGDLEAELQALLSGKAPQRKPHQAPKKVAPSMMDVEKMAAECMKDDDSDDDENLSGDEDLMAELKTLVPGAPENRSPPKVDTPSPVDEPAPPPPPKTSKPSSSSTVDLLSERMALYKEAEAVSKSCGDISKARRYGRAVKTLEGLMKSARAGNVINEEDIPPPVAVPKPKPRPPPAPTESENDAPPESQAESPPPVPPRQTPSRPAPTPPSATNSVLSNGDLSVSAQLVKRRDQYKVAALRAKKAGDTDTAIKYVRIAKKFDAVIEAEKSGQPVDLSNMPPPPPEFAINASGSTVIDERAPQSRVEEKNQMSSQPSEMEAAALAAASGPEDPSVFNAPPPPSSVLEALEQRLEKFCSTRDSAQAEGNSSKARRLNRIVQQYQTAIKNYKAGKPVDFEELPAPPGFAPIPVGGSAMASQPQVAPPKSPVPPKRPAAEGSVTPGAPATNKPAAPGQKGPSPPGANKGKLQRTNTSSVLEKQLNFLLERQKLFRQAALESKKNGDIQQAKEYLRMSKGFDSMIEATRSGLPIDATSIPTPPQLEADFVIIEKSDCFEETGEEESSEEVFRTIERDLEHQIEICARNKEHFLRLGDVSSASKFEKLGLNSKKDLAVVRHKWLNNDGIPRFHYETRLFSMVQCHTDLGDNEIEVAVERGINLPGKTDDLDSYVRIELPLPPETPLRAKTHTVRDTNNPIFQETFKFEFNRKSRSILRHFKRQALKVEIWSKGGFLRSDTLLGVASVKLVELESKCTIHDGFDLMEGRKACGGKIEVKVRIRDPLLAKQVEEVREKWLVIGS